LIVVIDTSVWVSALHFGARTGKPWLAIEYATRYHTLATCSELDAEIKRILMERFDWHADLASETMRGYSADAIQVKITGSLHICRDPNDDMILECAVIAGAQMIISGDKDLLVLDGYRGIRIVAPNEAIDTLSAQGPMPVL
jgi:uncharacterized protein